jgi:3-oxoacyl-[acyl-carrier protein] reductase
VCGSIPAPGSSPLAASPEDPATTDEAWRSAFESVFLGAVRLTRALAADLGGTGGGGAVGGSLTGAGGSIVFVLASSVRVPLAELAISNGLFPAASYITGAMIPVDGGAISSI